MEFAGLHIPQCQTEVPGEGQRMAILERFAIKMGKTRGGSTAPYGQKCVEKQYVFVKRLAV